jgi:hypothetical protein
MCKFASFVLTKGEVFWLKDSDSHEEIISKYNLHADGVLGPNILRVEITPSNAQTEFTDYASWVYRIDQDTMPSWFNAEYDEKRTREELIARAKAGFKLIEAIIEDVAPAWLDPYLKKHRGIFGGNLVVWGGAKLDALAQVGGNLVVSGGAKLDSLALIKVGGNLVVWGGAKLDALAQVGGNLVVWGGAKLDALALIKVGGNLVVSGGAKLDALAQVGGNLEVSGRAKLDAPLLELS